MWIHEIAPERLAELFHHYHQALMPESDKDSESRATWSAVPQREKGRMVAAARLALLELGSMASEPVRSRKYFAKPGEAEWGC